jgi:hypothetical protein
MSQDYDLQVLRRGDTHIIASRQYAVVVRNKDLVAGLREAEARIANAAAELRDAGIEPDPAELSSANDWQSASQLAVTFAPSIAVAAVMSAFLLVASFPLVNAVSGLRHTLSGLMPNASTDSVDAAGRIGIDYLTRVANAVEQLTPERREELRIAVRKISVNLRPVLDEMRTPAACESCPVKEVPR